MEGYTYFNIFDTKGMEYIAILIFFAILIPFWLLLNRKQKPAAKSIPVLDHLTLPDLNIPMGILHDRSHCYSFLEKSGRARLGADNLLLHLTGDVTFVSLKKVNEPIRKGEVFGVLKQADKEIHLYSPVGGKIEKVNEKVTEDAALLRIDPYGKGWLMQIQPGNWVKDTSGYFLGQDALHFLNGEIIRFKDFLATHLQKTTQPVLMDGGALKDQVLADFPAAVWCEFEESFLLNKEKV